MKGRVFRVSVGDLNKDEVRAYRTIQLIAEDVQGREVLTNFHGMNFTSDMLKSLVRKWQTTIDAFVDVKTTDGYTLRLFALGFTKKRSNQRKLTSYAQSSQVKRIRAKMVQVMTREAASSDLKQLFQKFVAESIGKQIEFECEGIYPLQNVYVVKAKILKKPKFDRTILFYLASFFLEMHQFHIQPTNSLIFTPSQPKKRMSVRLSSPLLRRRATRPDTSPSTLPLAFELDHVKNTTNTKTQSANNKNKKLQSSVFQVILLHLLSSMIFYSDNRELSNSSSSCISCFLKPSFGSINSSNAWKLAQITNSLQKTLTWLNASSYESPSFHIR